MFTLIADVSVTAAFFTFAAMCFLMFCAFFASIYSPQGRRLVLGQAAERTFHKRTAINDEDADNASLLMNMEEF